MDGSTGGRSPVHLVTGSDEVLLADGAHELVHRLVGDADPNEVLDEFTGDDYELGDVLIAASTMSMFGERIVVARNAGRFSVAALAPLLAYLEDPPPDSVLVVVWEAPVTSGAKRSPLPKKLHATRSATPVARRTASTRPAARAERPGSMTSSVLPRSAWTREPDGCSSSASATT